VRNGYPEKLDCAGAANLKKSKGRPIETSESKVKKRSLREKKIQIKIVQNLKKKNQKSSNMRRIKIFLLLLTFLAATPMLAQEKKKPNLNKVESAVTKASKQKIDVKLLTEAKGIIDEAVVFEKLKDEPRTWYLKGMVYKEMYYTGTEVAGVSSTDALVEAGVGFRKSMELGSSTETYAHKALIELDMLWGDLLNEGVTAYLEKYFAVATTKFEYCSLMKPQDSTCYIYAGELAVELEDYARAATNYRVLVKIVPTKKHYATLISILKDGVKDMDAAYEVIREAKEVLKGDLLEINKLEIEILIAKEKVDLALAKLEHAIKKDPENVALWSYRALLYDRLTEAESQKNEKDEAKLDYYLDEAMKAYTRILELDEINLFALFNGAIVYNNKAKKYADALNLMAPDEYNQKKEAYELEIRKYLELAIPLMVKARELAPEDANVLYALESFYARLGKKEALKEVQDRMRKLGIIE
jgi:tetratricopeptide (TPR) repeat protein